MTAAPSVRTDGGWGPDLSPAGLLDVVAADPALRQRALRALVEVVPTDRDDQPGESAEAVATVAAINSEAIALRRTVAERDALTAELTRVRQSTAFRVGSLLTNAVRDPRHGVPVGLRAALLAG